MSIAPERLTVLGVRPSDARLRAELWRFVPDEADAIYRPTFFLPTPRRLAVAALLNPPVLAFLVLAVLGRQIHAGSPPPATAAVESVAEERGLPIEQLDVDPVDGILEQGPWWTTAAWVTTGLVVGAATLAVLDPTVLSVAVAFVTIPLTASYVLAHSGAGLQRRDGELAATVLRTARESRHRHPVVVVRERHVPGIADRAKDRLVPTDSRTVSTQLTADASLYGEQ